MLKRAWYSGVTCRISGVKPIHGGCVWDLPLLLLFLYFFPPALFWSYFPLVFLNQSLISAAVSVNKHKPPPASTNSSEILGLMVRRRRCSTNDRRCVLDGPGRVCSSWLHTKPPCQRCWQQIQSRTHTSAARTSSCKLPRLFHSCLDEVRASNESQSAVCPSPHSFPPQRLRWFGLWRNTSSSPWALESIHWYFYQKM